MDCRQYSALSTGYCRRFHTPTLWIVQELHSSPVEILYTAPSLSMEPCRRLHHSSYRSFTIPHIPSSILYEIPYPSMESGTIFSTPSGILCNVPYPSSVDIVQKLHIPPWNTGQDSILQHGILYGSGSNPHGGSMNRPTSCWEMVESRDSHEVLPMVDPMIRGSFWEGSWRNGGKIQTVLGDNEGIDSEMIHGIGQCDLGRDSVVHFVHPFAGPRGQRDQRG